MRPRADEARRNRSGKHAAMLLLCRTMAWPTAGYRLAEHPCQTAMLKEVAAAAEVEPETIPTAIDGCGVVTHALTLERMAHAFSRIARLDGGVRVAEAMRAHPELIRGPGAADTELMRLGRGWVAKGGAEGLPRCVRRGARARSEGRGRLAESRSQRLTHSSLDSGTRPGARHSLAGELPRRGRGRGARVLIAGHSPL